MVRITMVTLTLHPSQKKSTHFRTVADAGQWLNLNSFESFTAYAHCASGKNHRGTFRNNEEFIKWTKELK